MVAQSSQPYYILMRHHLIMVVRRCYYGEGEDSQYEDIQPIGGRLVIFDSRLVPHEDCQRNLKVCHFLRFVNDDHNVIHFLLSQRIF